MCVNDPSASASGSVESQAQLYRICREFKTNVCLCLRSDYLEIEE